MNLWKEATASDGRTYYFHTVSRLTSWQKPEDFDGPATPATPQPDSSADAAAWKEAKAADGRTYFYNAVTRQTRWDPPPGFTQQEQNARPAAPEFVAGGALKFGADGRGPSDRRVDRRDDRDHGLPLKPAFEEGRGGGRGGGMPWDYRQENTGFRGPMPVKTDEPEYSTFEQAEEAFFKLLRKHNISPDTPWEDALHQVIRDREYRALKDPKERKQAFEKYCVEVRIQEKAKERERQQKLREEYRKMLGTHDEIKHYTRWKTARPFIEREAVFKQIEDDDERHKMFDEYVFELNNKHNDYQRAQHRSAKQSLDTLWQSVIVDPDTKWRDAREMIKKNERFTSDTKFRALSNMDILGSFDNYIKALDKELNDIKQTEKRMKTRRERQTRDGFRQALDEKLNEGKIKPDTKWQDFQPLLAKDERYLNMFGNPGSSPLDLFWDVVEDQERDLRLKRNYALDVLEDKRYEMTIDTSLADFGEIMRSDPRTAGFSGTDMSLVFERLMTRIKRRAEDDKKHGAPTYHKAVDALRSVIKRVHPRVGSNETYDEVVPRLQGYHEFRVLDDEHRRVAFAKYIRRQREKEEEEHENDRRRDKDRDHRNGSRRDSERDRERRYRTRTPEVDAYEADRKKAQADRERQYRKASFGLTPPPRERRDDRDDRYRRYDRYERDSIYDRERREREMERERSYISRADPREKGRALDYGDEDAVGSRPSSVRKRRDSDVSIGSRRDHKRARSRRTRTPEPVLKDEEPALQSGSEEGEIEEV